MKALIVNDDGVDSPGLAALARVAVEAGLDVRVAAPHIERSGASAALTALEADGKLEVSRRSIEGLPDVEVLAVHGSPALITFVASYGAFGEIPDIVLSGINLGPNTGRAILHSGTVGAALTGGVNDACGLAVSLDVGLDPSAYHWDTAAAVVRRLIPVLLEHPRGTVFNVNVPNVPLDTEVDVREATLAPFGIVQTTMTEPIEGNVRLTVRELPDDPIEGTDAALLAAGFATITNVVAVQQASKPVFTGPRREKGALHVDGSS